MRLDISKDIQGRILDIGGGGEGVIGRLYGARVIAIDNCREELDEAPDCCEKRWMDARDLKFDDGSFPNVTFFYALMYMTKDVQEQALGEAVRVLEQRGRLMIWDTDICTAYPEPHTVHLEIPLADQVLQTTYGIIKTDPQASEDFLRILTRHGMRIEEYSNTDGQFYLCGRKE